MRQIQSLLKFVSLGLAVVLLSGSSAQAQKSGQELYMLCSACHKVGSDHLGPDLAGISERRTEEWLLAFIRNAPEVVSSGDPIAVELLEKFKPNVMPASNYTDSEIRTLLEYIAELEAGGGGKGPSPLDTATQEHFDLGKELFTGETRFENGGASCQSCHQVAGAGIMGGGSLAKDLTRSADRIGGDSVFATVKSLSYPLMAQAYADKALTDDEIFAVVAFIEKQSQDNVEEDSGLLGVGFLFSGLLGCAILIAIYSLIWKGRKRGCVYDEIHARQLGAE